MIILSLTATSFAYIYKCSIQPKISATCIRLHPGVFLSIGNLGGRPPSMAPPNTNILGENQSTCNDYICNDYIKKKNKRIALLLCCHTLITRLLHCFVVIYTVVILLSHSFNVVIKLLLHCCYTFIRLLLQFC